MTVLGRRPRCTALAHVDPELVPLDGGGYDRGVTWTSCLRLLRRLRRQPLAWAALIGLLTSTIALGPLSPATQNLGSITVAAACTGEGAADACEDDMVKMLELLQRTQQFQQIQEEEEHLHKDLLVGAPLVYARLPSLPEPRVLRGLDMSPDLLRPPRA
jgi:hypothetical protein